MFKRYLDLRLKISYMDINVLLPKELGEVPGSPENIKLKDFRPVSIFNSPRTMITQARYPVTDMHAHAWQQHTDVNAWVKIMDASNIERTIILSFETRAMFDSIVDRFAKHPLKFDVWCGFDYTGYDQTKPDWTDHAIAELVRCASRGAKGVGELGDKGLGEYYSSPVPGYGMHLNDRRLQPLLSKAGNLGLPVSVHIADPLWMYLPMNASNDGLMNAYKWRINMDQPGMLNYQELLDSFEYAVNHHPETIFIVCHLANCTHDLSVLANMLDRYPNLYADITSRLKEVGTVPRYAAAFFEKYQDRILFGSDLGYDPGTTMDFAEKLYQATFRILESADDHIYEHDLFKYHWPLYGLALPDAVLQKLYATNAQRVFDHALQFKK